MSPSTSLISLVVGLVAGNVFGVYLAQTYELPDLQNLLQNLVSKAQKLEKNPTDDTNSKDK